MSRDGGENEVHQKGKGKGKGKGREGGNRD